MKAQWSYQASLLWEAFIAEVRSYLPYCSTNKMVNFRDPATIIRESGACAPQPSLASGSQKVTRPTFQTKLIGSGVLWMVSLCGPGSYWHFAISTCHITQFSMALPVGSLWSHSTTSGVSFEDVAHTGGRYGSVIILPYFCPAKFQLATIWFAFRFTSLPVQPPLQLWL